MFKLRNDTTRTEYKPYFLAIRSRLRVPLKRILRRNALLLLTPRSFIHSKCSRRRGPEHVVHPSYVPE